ncbi:MAG: hypothetical protein ACU85V_12780, partial [Gammaproteobacteria bacterium]
MLTSTFRTSLFVVLLMIFIDGRGEPPTVAEMLDNDVASETSAEATANVAGPTTPSASRALVTTDVYRRDTPRSMVAAYLEAVGANDYDRAARYLDLRNLPEGMSAAQGPELAAQLEVILERGLWIDIDALSDDPDGVVADALPPHRDLLGTVDLKGVPTSLLLQRVPGPEQIAVWKVSSATVADIPALHRIYGYGRLGEWLSERVVDVEFLGLYAWQWVMMIGLLLGGYGCAVVLTWPLHRMLRRGQARDAVTSDRIRAPLNFLIMVLIASQWFDVLRPSIEARAIAESNTLLTIGCLWLAMALVDVIRERTAVRLEARGKPLARVLLRPAGSVVKVTIVVLALAIWVENLGFRATTLIAGLGVGGLAVAL